ncbi:unnamed protein product [Paramecium sonneborni]|uniref:Uncharacterized protein n=1 Tax=Paramecium sonneborni TaxID=65129 RepID=A0A8S1PQX0_9CILI|nr:unnamed protein product [Paramecium sonneborni]
MGICVSKQPKIQRIEGNIQQLNKLGGCYSKNKIKQGIWIEEISKIDLKLVEMGEYFNGQRIGKWMCFSKDKKINAGGSYDDEGRKKGKWIELWKFYSLYFQVIYSGEYNMNGIKIGRWDIMYKRHENDQYKQMQLLYKQRKNEVVVDYIIHKQIRKRLEIGQNWRKGFNIRNKSLIKVGRWDIMYCKYDEIEYKQMGIYKHTEVVDFMIIQEFQLIDKN